MDDWDDDVEEVVPKDVQEVAWGDEDADDDDVADDWDADPEEEKPKAVVQKPKKLSKKKIMEKQKKMEEEARLRRQRMTEAERAAEELDEKARLQRLVEMEDEKLAEELFMGTASAVHIVPDNQPVDITKVELKNEEDFEKLAKDLSQHVIQSAGKSKTVLDFLTAMVKDLAPHLTLDQLQKFKQSTNAVFNEKRKAETGKKKKASKKKSVNVRASAFDMGGDMGVGATDYSYDNADDYDFI